MVLHSSSEHERDPLAGFVEDEGTREVVAQVAAERGWPRASVQAGGVSTAARALAAMDAPRILVVDASDSDDPTAEVTALVGMVEAGTKIVVLGTINDVTFYRRLLAAGVAEYLVKPTNIDLVREALFKAEVTAEQPQRPSGRLVLFTGTRGGVGSTTIATSCAWLAANSLGRPTVLVDLDLQFGTVALSLDLEPGGGLREALSDPDRIDEVFLERAVARCGQHLAVLGGEEPFEDITSFPTSAAAKLLGAMVSKFEFVMVDLPAPIAVAHPDLLTMASEIVLVGDLSLTSLRDANRLRRFLTTLGYEGRVRVVANRVGPGRKGQLTKTEFERGLEGKIDHVVPLDGTAAAKTANVGAPLATAGRSPVVAAMKALVADLTGAKPRTRGLWNRLRW